MRTDIYVWRGITFEVAHGVAPKNRFLYRFTIDNVSPAKAHLPLESPRYGCHYVGKTELDLFPDFRAYLFARLQRDLTPALLKRNAQCVERARQGLFDL